MKKLFALLLVLMILLSALPSFCEEERFSVRNGIMFGMSKEEVMPIEENNGNAKYISEKDNGDVSYRPINIAGIDGGCLKYEFTDNKLEYIGYLWDSLKDWGWTANNIDNDYNTINDVLKSKYELVGEMDYSGNITGLNIEKIVDDISFNGKTEWSDITVIDFNEYLAKDGDDYVVIFIESYKNNTMIGLEYVLKVNYYYIESSVLEELANKNQELNEKRNTDL